MECSPETWESSTVYRACTQTVTNIPFSQGSISLRREAAEPVSLSLLLRQFILGKADQKLQLIFFCKFFSTKDKLSTTWWQRFSEFFKHGQTVTGSVFFGVEEQLAAFLLTLDSFSLYSSDRDRQSLGLCAAR